MSARTTLLRCSFSKNFLVDARVIIGLTAVDHDQSVASVAQLALDHRLHHDVEEVLDGGVFGQGRVQHPHGERPRRLERFEKFNQIHNAVSGPLTGRKADAVQPVVGVAVARDLEQPPGLVARKPEIIEAASACGLGAKRQVIGLPAS
jgi:hypothetical protein